MAILLDQPVGNPTIVLTPPKGFVRPEPEQQTAPSADFREPQGSKLDGLLILTCVICWLMLWAMHVYEILAWAMA